MAKGENWFLVMVLIVVFVVLVDPSILKFFSGQQAVTVIDDYYTYDDFRTGSLVFTGSSELDNCQHQCSTYPSGTNPAVICNMAVGKNSLGGNCDSYGYRYNVSFGDKWTLFSSKPSSYDFASIIVYPEVTRYSTQGHVSIIGDSLQINSINYHYPCPDNDVLDVGVESKKSFRGDNVRVVLTTPSDNCKTAATVGLGTKDSIQVSATPQKGGQTVIEFKPSTLDFNLIDVFVNGVQTSTQRIDPSSPTLLIIKGTVTVIQIKYKPVFSCTLGPNDFLAYEPLAGGRDVSLYSFRHSVKTFCADQHPVVIYDKSKGAVATSIEPYVRWVQGQTLSIPQGQVWGSFYVFENDGSVPVTCDFTNGEVYNVNLSRCVNSSGLATICSEGSFDAASGQCVITPETRTICPIGGRYDVTQNACIYNPPLSAVCNDPSAVYVPSTGKCEFTPPPSNVCSSGTVYNPQRGVCEAFPLKVIVCSDPLSSYDPSKDVCVRNLSSSSSCIGTYNASSGLCTNPVPPQPTCSKGILAQKLDGSYICIYSPDISNSCPQGSYDSVRNACIVVPDLQYLCINGKLSADKTSCIITTNTSTMICPSNSVNVNGTCISSGSSSKHTGMDWIDIAIIVIAVAGGLVILGAVFSKK